MLQLEVLWNLQCVDKEIAKIKNCMKDKKYYNKLNEIKKEYETVKEQLSNNTDQLKLISVKTAELNAQLEGLEQKAKKKNEKLYADGTNIKEIQNIQKELYNYKKLIDEIENQLLKCMEREDILEANIRKQKESLLNLKGQFVKIKKMYLDEKEENICKLNELTNKRETIIKEIDDYLMEQYNHIASQKNNPVSIVSNGICTECGLRLNVTLYNTVKRKDSISFCEHCGRILYIK